VREYHFWRQPEEPEGIFHCRDTRRIADSLLHRFSLAQGVLSLILSATKRKEKFGR
jgi:hypothetical protein